MEILASTTACVPAPHDPSTAMTHSNVDEGRAPYHTLATHGEAEHVVERSRFLAHALPVTSIEQAQAFVDALRSDHYDARHVCFGLRVGRGAQGIDRSNDDGEPARTGGFPLWQLLDGADVVDALIAVVRYYGGVKLGMGGLARAYREAGRAAMEQAGVVQRWPEARVHLTIPYEMLDRLNHLLDQLPAARTLEAAYTDDVTLTLAIRKANKEEVAGRIAALVQRDAQQLFEE